MIKYPILKNNATIGVTAPSSGVESELHQLIHEAKDAFTRQGYQFSIGETVWTQVKAKSAPAEIRANDFETMIQDANIDAIIPPWGGELAIETLKHIDFNRLPNKWILGYSDTSSLLLAITLNTGIATAHGPNLVDLRGEYQDHTTSMWKTALSTKAGSLVTQFSSEKYQKEWDHQNPSPCIFHLTEKTEWKTIGSEEVKMEGRILGGCIDIIKYLIGTPYGNVKTFRENYTNSEPIIWYLENCEMNTTDLRRSLIQMQLAGWFDDCSGILFGRSPANEPVQGYNVEDVYLDLASDLQIPIVYDIDCGHVPPQITFINGASATVEVKEGKGTITQHFI